MKINAVILAGGQTGDKLKDYTNVKNEALIPIGERPMIDYVLNAVKETKYIENIAVAGPIEELQKEYGQNQNIFLAPSGNEVIDSVKNALKVLDESDYVLVVSSDIPLINSEALIDFMDKCLNKESMDLYYPVIERALSEEKYPGVKRTYVSFVEGDYTGGNVFLLRPEIVEPRVKLAKRLIDLRKSPVKLCRVIGFTFALKLLLRRLSIPEVERKACELLDLKGMAVTSEYPEIGIDVDKPGDLEQVRKALLKP